MMFDPQNIAITKEQIRLIHEAKGKILAGTTQLIDGVIVARRHPPSEDDGLWHGHLVLVDCPPHLNAEEITPEALGLLSAEQVDYDTSGESGLESSGEEQTDPQPEAPAASVEESDDDDSAGKKSPKRRRNRDRSD